MPIYEYRCEHCLRTESKYLSMEDRDKPGFECCGETPARSVSLFNAMPRPRKAPLTPAEDPGTPIGGPGFNMESISVIDCGIGMKTEGPVMGRINNGYFKGNGTDLDLGDGADLTISNTRFDA